MRNLTNNSLPAERAGGCIGAENFESVAAVMRNGGTITGTPLSTPRRFTGNGASYIKYSLLLGQINKLSVIIDTLTTSADVATENIVFSNLVTSCYFFGSRLYFAISSGGFASGYVGVSANTTYKNISIIYNGSGAANADKLKIYINGVSQVLTFSGTIQTSFTWPTTLFTLGSYPDGTKPLLSGGSFSLIKFFKQALSTEEILAYSNGTMWSYMRSAVLVMDGKLNSYEPDNARILDRSGNGNHMSLGNGVTATTFPTKRLTRGWTFDGTTDYLTLPSRVGKFAYAYYQLATGQAICSAVTTIYDNIATAGQFTGSLYYLLLSSVALNATQLLDLQSSINLNTKE